MDWRTALDRGAHLLLGIAIGMGIHAIDWSAEWAKWHQIFQ